MSDTCQSCRFWNPLPVAGECRRHFPLPREPIGPGDTKPERSFPAMHADEWCGEFESRPRHVPAAEKAAGSHDFTMPSKCPNCGSDAAILHTLQYGVTEHRIWCSACGARTPKRAFRNEAIESWNRGEIEQPT